MLPGTKIDSERDELLLPLDDDGVSPLAPSSSMTSSLTSLVFAVISSDESKVTSPVILT